MSGGPAGAFRYYDFAVLVRDLDPQAHMANHVYVAYLSEARARFLGSLEGHGDAVLPSVVADVRCSYESPLLAGEAFRVGVRVASVGRTSIAFEYEILATDRRIARAESVEVLIDAETRLPREVPAALRAELAGSPS